MKALSLGEAVRGDRISYWLDSTPPTDYPSLESPLEVDVAVVGGGMVGLTAGLLLAEAGRSVVVLEADRIASGTSGYTTAKLTAGHGLLYAHLEAAFDEATARLYAESQTAAIAAVGRRVAEAGIDCSLESRPNVVYADRERDVSALEEEVAAEVRAGLPAELVGDAGLPFPTFAALVLRDQFQFHPRAYLLALAALLERAGGTIVEQTRVTTVGGGDRVDVETERASVRARHVLVATHYPVVEHGFFATRIHPSRAYAVAAPLGDGDDLGGMFINAASPTRSLRTVPLPEGGRLLIAGGEGHRVGQEPDTKARYEALETFARDWFPVGEIRYRWSTQDPSTVDRVPYVGEVEPGSRVYVATGFAGWGMSNGTLAGMLLSDAVQGLENEWARVYALDRRSVTASARRFVTENTAMAWQQVSGSLRAGGSVDDVAPGAADVVSVAGEQAAVWRDAAGALHAVSAKCTHMGCTVAWNVAESSWDCPCHGSRFAPDGRVLRGPAARPLAPVDASRAEREGEGE